MNYKQNKWYRIGPGLILALAISAFLGAKWINTKINTPVQQPIIEKQTISSSYEEKLGPTPTINFILDNNNKIKLSNSQIAKLKLLDMEWNKYYNLRIVEAKKAASKTSAYLSGSNNKTRTPIAIIQQEAAPLISISSEISKKRHDYWKKAILILDLKQRNLLDKEREASWLKQKNKFNDKLHNKN